MMIFTIVVVVVVHNWFHRNVSLRIHFHADPHTIAIGRLHGVLCLERRRSRLFMYPNSCLI